MTRRIRLIMLGIMLAPAVVRGQGGSPFGRCPAHPGQLATPFAWLVVNGACVDLSSHFVANPNGVGWTLNADPRLAAAAVQLNLIVDADPFITFGATTTNLTSGATTYAFLFGTPIVPGFYGNATSTGGVSVTNGAGGTAVVSTSLVYPTFVSGYGTLGLTPTNLGVDLGTASCQAGPGTPGGVTQTCNYGTASNSFGPTFYDNLEALLTYTQTDTRSVASWSGGVTLSPPSVVPEPSTLTLLLAGALGLAGIALRRGTRRAEWSDSHAG